MDNQKEFTEVIDVYPGNIVVNRTTGQVMKPNQPLPKKTAMLNIGSNAINLTQQDTSHKRHMGCVTDANSQIL